eukprot:2795670-Pyramimonas_sp.AAC.1
MNPACNKPHDLMGPIEASVGRHYVDGDATVRARGPSGAIGAILSARDHCKAHWNIIPLGQRAMLILAADFLRR